ncbi:MAG: translocation/assembly module TamB domain-containing protein [Hyphomonadaceae bacterium]
MEKATRKKTPVWLRLSFWLMALVLALLTAAVVLRFWITSDAGRAFVASQIDGRRLGVLGTVRLSGLQGDPLGAATVADIALVDDDGVWLRARDVRLEWTPTALFAGELEIRSIGVRLVDVLRAPTVANPEAGGPGPDIGIRLDELKVETLRLAEPVLGIEAAYALSGAVASPREGAGFARLGLSPQSGPADTANISIDWEKNGTIEGLANVAGPADGLIASLLQGPDDRSVGFVGKLNGTTEDFTGEGTLSFGGEAAATLSVARKDDQATLAGELRAIAWPLMAPVFERTGGAVAVNGRANVADLARAATTLDVSAPAGEATLAAQVDLTTFSLVSPVTVDAKGLDLARLAPPLSGLADAKGEVAITLPSDFQWTGDISAAQLTWPSGSAAAVSGPVRVRKQGATLDWRASGLTLTGARIDALPDMAPGRYMAATAGEYNLRTGALDIYDTQVEGAAGSATARGSIAPRTGAIDFNGSAKLTRLEDLSAIAGSANGRWTARQASPGAPLRLEVAADGRDLSSGIQGFNQLIGPTPHVEVSGVVRGGHFTLESGVVEAAGLNAEMTGRITDSGAITAAATGRLSRPVEINGTTFRRATFEADITGTTEAPKIDARLTDADLAVAGLDLTNVGGDATLQLGEGLSGAFTLSGDLLGQRLHTQGRIASDTGSVRIAGLSAELGQLRAEATRLVFGDNGVIAEFTASGPLTGVGGIEAGTLTLNGSVNAGETITASVQGRAANLRRGTTRIEVVAFEGGIRNDVANLQASVRGRLPAPLELELGLTGRRNDADWMGEATLEGEIDGLDIATARPAAWRIGPDGWSADAALSAFDGTLDAQASTRGGVVSLNADLQGVNLRALARLARVSPVNGQATGMVAFRNDGSNATGDVRLSIENANPVGVTANPVSLDVRAELRDHALASTATGSGQGFSLDASSRVPVRVGQGFDLAVDPDAALTASVSLDGRAEQVWALFGPENQSMRGELAARMQAGGTLAHLTLDGGFEMKDGAYEHGETGLLLDDIDAEGVFNQQSAQVTKFEATDGNGGRLTAQGALDWTGDVSGKISFDARKLRALGRDDRFAIVSGQGALELVRENIAVTGDFNIEEARISVEQPAAANIPTLPGLRRVNFPNQTEETPDAQDAPWQRPVQLDLKVRADNRIVVFGRGLDTEWAANFTITGPIADPSINGTATMVRGSLDLGGRRFSFDTGTISLDGPIRRARIDIAAERVTDEITATVRVSGTPVDPKFTLESTPALPQDEVLARVLFGRSAAELSGFEAAQLAAGLAQLAGGQAGFDPIGLVREATGLDRLTVGAQDGIATVSAGKYIADNVYLQVGTGGSGGVGAEVEWEPSKGLSIISSADGNGDTKISVRWKKDYGAPETPPPAEGETPEEAEQK